MNEWRDAMVGAFGTEDGEFALHPLDLQHAEVLVAHASNAGATQDEVVDAIIAHGLSLGWTGEHLAEQATRVRAFVVQQW